MAILSFSFSSFDSSIFFLYEQIFFFISSIFIFKMSALPSIMTFDEYLNEQLINCLNLQTNVIQNLAQYSQHISLQLIEIKVCFVFFSFHL